MTSKMTILSKMFIDRKSIFRGKYSFYINERYSIETYRNFFKDSIWFIRIIIEGRQFLFNL
jgi:hypothetical protein